ncbi:MAG: putative lipid II flippase FtsW [Proteobacteria bacterium]|nr:putative lipid II flippase FtsW [Pseudomonadota bacterium]
MSLSLWTRRAAVPMLYDRWLLLASVGLLSIGILMVASTSIVISERQFHEPFHYLTRQVVFLVGGLIAGLVLLRVDMEFWQKTGGIWLILSLFLLTAVLIPGIGRTVNGSTRWIAFGPVALQVSEIAKLSVIIYLAGYLVRRHEEVRLRMIGFLKPMFILSIAAVLLLKEPDFGAVVVMFATALGMMFLAGARLWQFIALLIAVGAAVGGLAVSSHYRLARLTAFLDPWANQYDSGYQLTQSLIAFGRGGWFGVGLGESIQKLFYLPEAHTDFLFAVLTEEWGLMGALIVIILFAIFIIRSFQIGRQAQHQGNLFNAYLAYGIGLWVGLQAMINIGVNSGVLPTKGLTLPFMSSGGSSLLVNCIGLALLLRIDHETRWRKLGLG